MMDDRLRALERHEIWSRLCELADQLLELSQLWWTQDDELAAAHYDSCLSADDQYELPFAQPHAEDEPDF